MSNDRQFHLGFASSEYIEHGFRVPVTLMHTPQLGHEINTSEQIVKGFIVDPIEHRLFSQVSLSWAGQPLISYDVVLDALRSTTTATGLSVEATLNETRYEKGLSVFDQDMSALLIERQNIYPHWNYTIRPRKTGTNF